MGKFNVKRNEEILNWIYKKKWCDMKTCNFNSNISVKEEIISGLKLKFKTWQSFIQVLLIFERELLGRFQFIYENTFYWNFK